jgi:hypothetical protein
MTADGFRTGADSMGFDRRATEPVWVNPHSDIQLRDGRIGDEDADAIDDFEAATVTID